MIIVDTSIWANHFRKPIKELQLIVSSGQIRQHPFVTGELALGNPVDRRKMVAMLAALDQAAITDHNAVLKFAEQRSLGGTGIGYVDAHLLASAAFSGATLWTRDNRLARQAELLGALHIPE